MGEIDIIAAAAVRAKESAPAFRRIDPLGQGVVGGGRCERIAGRSGAWHQRDGFAAQRPVDERLLPFARRGEHVVAHAAEGAELERLRADPTPAAAKALLGRLTCAKLRPQLQRVMESLGVAPPAEASSAKRAVAAPPTPEGREADCASESAELLRLRTRASRKATLAFAEGLRCKSLKPQVARLLESLSD